MCRYVKHYFKITLNEKRCCFTTNFVPVKDLQEDIPLV